jgi:glutamyl-tRNA synthetase
VALSGKQSTPGGGVEIAYIIGKKDTIDRVKKGIEKLS